MLPDAITHGGSAGQAVSPGEFTVSQVIPEQQFPGENPGGLPPLRTAAELGFDDSRYADVPDDIRELDPIGRSRHRAERRATLGAQTQAQPQDPPAVPEAPGYPEELTGQQQAYDTGQAAYPEQQQTAYGRQGTPSYGETYYAPDGTPQQSGTYATGGGYPDPAAQAGAAAYPEQAQQAQTPVQAAPAEQYVGFQEQPYQGDWPQTDGYPTGYSAEQAPQAESIQAADGAPADRVGFDRPGPTAAVTHELTDAGLPRRGSAASGANGSRSVTREAPATSSETNADGGWRSANDERWQQAAQLRKPKAGGVTASGLPLRVPKANLVEGTAEATPQGGPQVSRAPEDVRGRLSNLRQGVQRGRSAGSEKNGQATRNGHRGPDSTYNQER
jgi:hypothetical protein